MEGARSGEDPRNARPRLRGCRVHGAVYRGSARVGEWIDAWFGEGNTIEVWDITALLVTADTAAMEWRFTCTWHGRPASFEGASVARFSATGIAYLREYQTVAELYDWEGTWRE